MLVHTANWLIEDLRAGRTGRALDQNVYIESFCIHARNMIEVLVPRPADDTIRMTDFLLDEPIDTSPEAARLRADRPKIHHRIAHPSRGRHKDFDGWPVLRITGDLIVLLKRFVERIEDARPELRPAFNRSMGVVDAFRLAFAASYAHALGIPVPAAQPPPPGVKVFEVLDVTIGVDERTSTDVP